MTLEAWVNPPAINAGWKDVIYKGNDNYYLEGATPAECPMIGITVGASQAEAFGTSQLPSNTWTFLAATYDGTTLRFYVNGTQISSQPRTGDIVTSANPLQIGGDSIWGQFFHGTIDEVRVYNVALTPGQIQADMATSVGGSSAAVSLSALSLDFGNQSVGTASAPGSITVTNGGTVPLNITAVSVSGAQASDFAQSSNCIGSVAPFGSCTITVTFTPGNAGTRSGSVVITNNAPGNPHSVALTGVGTGFRYIASDRRCDAWTDATVHRNRKRRQQRDLAGRQLDRRCPGDRDDYGGRSAYAADRRRVHVIKVATTDGSKSATATVYVTHEPGVC